MSQSDPIADVLTQVRNASRARLEKTDVPDSRVARALLEVLKREGFIHNIRVVEAAPRARLRVYLKYLANRRPVISGLRRVSTPGLRRYVGVEAIPSVLQGLGISVVSTPKGMLTDAEAKAQRVGGELICQVW